MTIESKQPNARKTRLPGRSAILAAQLVLFWERLWPALLPVLIAPFLYVTVSLFDLWGLFPAWLHWLMLGGGAATTAWLGWKYLAPLPIPARREAQARLEEDGNVRHAALQALDDKPFDSAESFDSPLWRAHLEDMKRRARNARLKGVRASATARDPFGLRFTALGILVVAMIASGQDAMTRLALGFDPSVHGAGGRLVADLWIEPPAYAARAPIYLMRAGARVTDDGQINAPEGSVLVAQVNGGGNVRLTYATRKETLRATFTKNRGAQRGQIAIGESGLLRLALPGKENRWPIGIIRDDPPNVAFVEGPARTDDARLEFTVAIEDDYGVTDARLVLQLDPDQERPLDAPAFGPAALAETRSIPLPGVAGAEGERHIALDLQADPWAGLKVLAKVVVTDGAGQEGASEAARTTLPARLFFNPIAKAVIEQRQTLAVAAERWRRTARSFDAITLAPDRFFTEKPTDYLMLRAAFWRVMRDADDGYDDAVAQFWPLALQLEDEALELARQRLEAAQEALREALERGAGDDEINRLVEALRQAMNDYLSALAQSGQQMQSAGRNAQQVEQTDLDEMLDAIRDLSEQGAGNAARQMLSDLENILNNLRLSQSGSGQSGQGGQGQNNGDQSVGGMAGEAGELIGRQRELADETFERRREGEDEGGDLAGREGALGGDLDDLLNSMQSDSTADPNGDAARAFGSARSAMREAENALDADDLAAAGDAMERAIANLRDGAETLAREQMRQGENGEGQEASRARSLDPLGRESGQANGDGVDVPGEGEAGRSRAIIDELRRRLGEPDRDEDEVDYLERLLDRF